MIGGSTPRELVARKARGSREFMAVDKSEARVRRMFGEIAGRYDFLNHLLSLGVDVYWRWRTVRKVPPAGDAPILDLCTGTGDLALAYHQAGRGRAAVVGADFCHPMLVIGRTKAEPGQGRPDRLRRGRRPAAAVRRQSFQIVSVAFGLRNVTDTDRGLREMFASAGRADGSPCSSSRMPSLAAVSRPFIGWYFQPRPAADRPGAGAQPARCLQLLAGERGRVSLRRGAGRADAGAPGPATCGYYPLTLGVATLYVGTK